MKFPITIFLSLALISCQNQNSSDNLVLENNKINPAKDSLEQLLANIELESIKINPVEDTLKHLLANEIETLELTYTNWTCTCTNWLDYRNFDSEKEDWNEFLSTTEQFYVEAADSRVEIPYGFPKFNSTIKFTGKRYKEKTTPKNNPWANPEGMDMNDYLDGLVFRYYSYEIIEMGTY